MKPVDQTLFGEGKGDCMRACVASILELPIDQVPNFIEQDDMAAAVKQWLAQRGVTYLSMYFLNPPALDQTHFEFAGDYCIVGGTSPRKNDRGDHLRHAVVGKVLPWGVEIVHDPHPSRDGLLNWGPRWLELLVPVAQSTRNRARLLDEIGAAPLDPKTAAELQTLFERAQQEVEEWVREERRGESIPPELWNWRLK